MNRRIHPIGLVVLLLYAAVSLAPIFWLVLTSIKQSTDIVATPPRIIPTIGQEPPPAPMFRFTLDGYRRILARGGDSPLPSLVNSVIVASVVTSETFAVESPAISLPVFVPGWQAGFDITAGVCCSRAFISAASFCFTSWHAWARDARTLRGSGVYATSFV